MDDAGEPAVAAGRERSVRGRWPIEPNICGRDNAIFTGRFVSLAAIAASVTCGHDEPFEPNPPPMKRETTRTFSVGTPNTAASLRRAPMTPCVAS